MIWKILIVTTLILSGWAAWGVWQNTKTLGKMMEIVDGLHEIIKELLKKEEL